VYGDKCSAYVLQINMFAEPNRWTVQRVCFGYQGLAVAVSSNRSGAAVVTENLKKEETIGKLV
jgi:hypothetical protein